MADALSGADILGRDRTGSGKTRAFCIPLVVRLAGGHTSAGRPRRLVLVPTRELASQVPGRPAGRAGQPRPLTCRHQGAREFRPGLAERVTERVTEDLKKHSQELAPAAFCRSKPATSPTQW